MQIAIIAPLVAPIVEGGVPLGGAQAMLTDLCLGLALAGHQVTLLAASGSRVPGIHIPDLGIDSSVLVPAQFTGAVIRTDDAQQRTAFARVRSWLDDHQPQMDVVHAHAFDGPSFDCLGGYSRPVLHTLHLPPVDPVVLSAATAAAPPAALVCVSEDSARLWREAGASIQAVVPNGIRLADIPRGEGTGGYLLFAGRLSPEKGADIAIRCAQKAQLPLLLAGDMYNDQWALNHVAPSVRSDPDWQPGTLVEPGATYLGPRTRNQVFQLMGEASAILMPVRIDEAFGLVAVEAQAAGTPVVAFDRGALREVVLEGETGILVPPGNDQEQLLAAAIPIAVRLDRARCRAWAIDRFASTGMVRAYEQVYFALIEEQEEWASRTGSANPQT